MEEEKDLLDVPSALARLDDAQPTALPHEDQLIVCIASAWELSPQTTAEVLGCSVSTLPRLDLSYLQVGEQRRYMKKVSATSWDASPAVVLTPYE